PTILMRNVYILPGVPEIFRQKFEAIRERFRGAPIHLRNVFVSIGEGTLDEHLNGVLADFPVLLLGSYPEFSNPEYKVKVTLESQIGRASCREGATSSDRDWSSDVCSSDLRSFVRSSRRSVSASVARRSISGTSSCRSARGRSTST